MTTANSASMTSGRRERQALPTLSTLGYAAGLVASALAALAALTVLGSPLVFFAATGLGLICIDPLRK